MHDKSDTLIIIFFSKIPSFISMDFMQLLKKQLTGTFLTGIYIPVPDADRSKLISDQILVLLLINGSFNALSYFAQIPSTLRVLPVYMKYATKVLLFCKMLCYAFIIYRSCIINVSKRADMQVI